MPQPFLFVTVGTTDFDPLVHKVDELVPKLGTQAGVMQIGNGHYRPVNMPYFRFAPSLAPYYTQATLVIAHGGIGITMEALSHGLPLVSVSNADRYDQHQAELLRTMAEEGYLCWCQELDGLEAAIEDAQSKMMRRYTRPECNIHRVIDHYLSPVNK
jgi:UDP-N-acetylglucosamine transferase subunit ALG13